MHVGEAIIQQLEQWNVEALFGVSGSSLLPMIDALRRQSTIRYVTVRHEEAAALAASAYAKLTGRPGVCWAHAGPGAAHLINGLYDAHKDGYPVLAITGQVPTDKMGTPYKQAADADLMFVGCTGFSRTVTAASAALPILVEAMRYAVSMGDVAHVAIPSDLLAVDLQDVPLRPWDPFLTIAPQVDSDAVNAAAQLLDGARHPIILMGYGARDEASTVLAMAERMQAPIITSLPAKGSLDEGHPLVCGPIGEAGTSKAAAAVQEADAVLILGSSWWPQQFMPQNARVVQVDVRPTAMGAQHPVDIGIVGRSADVLPALAQRLRARTRAVAPVPAGSEDVGAGDQFPAHPARIMQVLRDQLPRGAVVAVDTGLVTLWYGRCFPARQETTLISGRWRTMGFGVPAAVAAKVARPRAAVVAVVGDGGFGMAAMEFVTAVQHRLPIVVLVLNNGLLGEEAAKQDIAGMPIYGMDLQNPRWAAFAEACGGRGYHPADVSDLAECLRDALTHPLPALIDIPTRFAAPPTLSHGSAKPKPDTSV